MRRLARRRRIRRRASQRRRQRHASAPAIAVLAEYGHVAGAAILPDELGGDARRTTRSSAWRFNPEVAEAHRAAASAALPAA